MLKYENTAIFSREFRFGCKFGRYSSPKMAFRFLMTISTTVELSFSYLVMVISRLKLNSADVEFLRKIAKISPCFAIYQYYFSKIMGNC